MRASLEPCLRLTARKHCQISFVVAVMTDLFQRGQLLVKEFLVAVPRVVLVMVAQRLNVPAPAQFLMMSPWRRKLNWSLLSQRTELRTCKQTQNVYE